LTSHVVGPDGEPLLSTEEAARFLRRSVQQFRKFAHSRGLKARVHVRVGSSFEARWSGADLLAYLPQDEVWENGDATRRDKSA
jgi:hypothetical protein